MSTEGRIHYEHAKSRERFWQDAGLVALAAVLAGMSLPEDASDEAGVLAWARDASRMAFALADEAIEQHGPDSWSAKAGVVL